MQKKSPQIQDGFLFSALREGRPLSLHTMSGGELSGTLKRFDQYTLVLETQDGSVVVYKSAVAAIQETKAS